MHRLTPVGLLLMLATATSAGAGVTLDGQGACGFPASVVGVPVALDTDGTAVALQFDVTYDETLVTPVGAEGGAAWGDHVIAWNVVGPGQARFVIYSPTNDPFIDGQVAHLPFSVSAGATVTAVSLALPNAGVVVATAGGGDAGLIGSPASALVGLDCATDNGHFESDVGHDVGTLDGATPESAWVFYSIDVPFAADGLQADLTALSGDANLFLRQGYLPGLTDYDCASMSPGTANEQCYISSSPEDLWWIGINNQDTGSITYTLDVQVICDALLLESLVLSAPELFEVCGDIVIGPFVQVIGSADVTVRVRPGRAIRIGNGFSVEAGARVVFDAPAGP